MEDYFHKRHGQRHYHIHVKVTKRPDVWPSGADFVVEVRGQWHAGSERSHDMDTIASEPAVVAEIDAAIRASVQLGSRSGEGDGSKRDKSGYDELHCCGLVVLELVVKL